CGPVLSRAVANQLIALIANCGGVFRQDSQDGHTGFIAGPVHFPASRVSHAAVIYDSAVRAGVIARPPPFPLVIFTHTLASRDLGAGSLNDAGPVTTTVGLIIKAGHGEVNIPYAGLIGIDQIR